MKNYLDFLSLRMKSRLTKCTVDLEHSVSGEYYWLSSEVRLFAKGEPDLLVHLGGGDKNNPKVIFSTLEARGFNQVNRREMWECEYFNHERVPESDSLSSPY